jgi:hypothetical protein
MLATLNSSQIVDAIVKDAVRDNDPHDAVQISPDVVLASRPVSIAPSLAPEIVGRPEPTFAPEPTINPEPKFGPPAPSQPELSSVDSAVRVAAGDGHGPRQRSAARKWLRGAFVTFLFAGGSAAATIAWDKHGDAVTPMLAQWTPALASLWPSTSPTAPVAAAQATPAATDQAGDQPVAPPAVQIAAPTTTPTQPADAAPPVQSMTRDLGLMAQQIELLKASIAELKAGQEQMAREMAKQPAPKPVTEARPAVDPRARVSTLPPRAPVPTAPPVRKPKPVVSHTYMPAYAPAPLASSPPAQAAAMPPPAPPVATTQAVADDDGPVVRPPMPLR